MKNLFENLTLFDRRLRLVVNPDNELSRFSAKFNISSPSSIMLTENYGRAFLYFKEEVHMKREIRILLQEGDARFHDGIWRVSFSVSGAKSYVKAVRRILQVPSCVNVFTHNSKGSFIMDFLFHHSDEDEISSAVLDCVHSSDVTEVMFLGPFDDPVTYFTDLFNLFQLVAIAFEMELPPSALASCGYPEMDHWMRILKVPLGEKMVGVLFSESPIKEKGTIKQIIPGEMYVSEVRNPVFLSFTREYVRRKNPPLLRIQKFDAPILRMVDVIPGLFVSDALRTINKVIGENPQWRTRISCVLPIDSFINMERECNRVP